MALKKAKMIGGVTRPQVTTGPADPIKARIAKKAVGGGGFGISRSAGMMLDTSQVQAPYMTGYKLEAYRTSYAYGLSDRTGSYDIPNYFVMMNEKNGGILYWPVTLHEKYSWYRYWSRSDSYVGRGLELLSDLPMSKLTLNMPKMENKELQAEILEFFNYQMEVLNLFEHCQSLLWELNMIGNCFPADHLVHTENGMIPICQIREKDKVLMANGEYGKVSGLSRRHVSEWLIDIGIDRLTAVDFTPTGEHPILLLRNGEEKMVKAKEVRVGDYVGVAFDNTVVDVESKDIGKEIGDILKGRYDKVSVSSLTISDLKVSVEYVTPEGSSFRTAEIKDKIVSWMSKLDKETDLTCEEVASQLGVSDVEKFRSVAYLMRKRGLIETKRIGAGKNGSSIRWFPLKNIKDFSDVYGRVSQRDFTSKIKTLEIDEDFLYLLGYWLGDGWLWEYKRPTSYPYLAFDICAESNTKQCDRLTDVMSSVFGEGNYSSGDSVIFGDSSMFHVSVEDPIFCAWWGYNFGSNCDNKKLPNWIMELPPEKQIWILRGMIDSDGSVTERNDIGDAGVVSGIESAIVNTNANLMHQLFQVGIRCGIPFCFQKQSSSVQARVQTMPDGSLVKNSKPCYTLKISDNEIARKLLHGCVKSVEIPLRNSERGSSWIFENGKFYYRVASTGRKFHDGFVYNFEVDGDHTYCVNQIRTHNCFTFHEWDKEKKMWVRAQILPPEEVYVFQYPFSDKRRVEYRPQRLIALIRSAINQDSSQFPVGDCDRTEMNDTIIEEVPKEMRDMVDKEGCIVMDSDPMTGSFVHHMARRKHPYHDLGASVLERILVPMLQKEHYRYTQLSLASRNMTPKNLITAPGLMPDEVDELRTQVDLSYLDPEYSVITNYEVNWQQLGTQDRFLDFSREYEQIENQIFAALGVTRELLTGEGQFSGTKITVEILNTMFMLSREVLKSYIEKSLFIPICEAHGWFEERKNGVKKYFCPQVGFNRLTIRDNSEVFDSLFQLYTKGSLPVEVVYELFNLNAEEMSQKLKDGLFTAKDATFNRLTEEVNVEVGRSLVQQTDAMDRVAAYLGFNVKQPADAQPGDEPVGLEPIDDGSGDADAAPAEEEGIDQRLNGAQVQALQKLLTDVASGALPAEAAKQMILMAFPSLPHDAIDKMIESATGGKYKPAGGDAPATAPDGTPVAPATTPDGKPAAPAANGKPAAPAAQGNAGKAPEKAPEGAGKPQEQGGAGKTTPPPKAPQTAPQTPSQQPSQEQIDTDKLAEIVKDSMPPDVEADEDDIREIVEKIDETQQ